jgi:hypothetical protein
MKLGRLTATRRMNDTRSRLSWLSRNGVWIRRSLMAIVLAVICTCKAAGMPDDSSTARNVFFLAIGLGGVGLLLYAAEYLLAVRHRGYWFDHDVD